MMRSYQVFAAMQPEEAERMLRVLSKESPAMFRQMVDMGASDLHISSLSAPLIRKTIDGDDRLKLFERAFAKYPRNVPFNVILMPMEGDPNAPSAFWVAARATGGSYMSPSKDWP